MTFLCAKQVGFRSPLDVQGKVLKQSRLRTTAWVISSLKLISSEFDCFAIAGDFNIHIDDAEIKTTKEIITALNTFDLIQHVHGPTHNRGHTLDLLISRGLNISSIVINDVALSDHFCIFFDISICYHLI